MSADGELVSVVIPFYNCERFLGEAIESVLAQTYTHWELVLVDDGSTDESTQIAKSFAAKHAEKICCLEHEEHANRGVNASRNFGVKKSSGELLAFLDSDDVWLPEKLEHSLHLMAENKEAAMLYGPSEYWHDWDPGASETNSTPPVAPGPQIYAPPVLLRESYPIGRLGAPCTSSIVVRRVAFNQAGGFDESFNPSTFQIYEDIAFFSAIFLRFPVFVHNRALERYRCSPDSMWHSAARNTRDEKARRFYYKWLNKHMQSNHLRDEGARRAVWRAAWPYRLPLPSLFTHLMRRAENRRMRVKSESQTR